MTGKVDVVVGIPQYPEELPDQLQEEGLAVLDVQCSISTTRSQSLLEDDLPALLDQLVAEWANFVVAAGKPQRKLRRV